MDQLFGRSTRFFNNDRRFVAFQETDKHHEQQLAHTNTSMNMLTEFPTNFISTSRYSLISFLPMSLLLQFKRYANIYFLITAILQCIPAISPLSAYVAVAPLIFVLAVSMTREGFEDYARHKSDREQNYQAKAKRITFDRSEQEIAWADIRVGDILKVSQDECFPADLLVLGSNLEGVCYIETGALDGEKNLKPKSALTETEEYFSTVEVDNIVQIQEKKTFRNRSTDFTLQISGKRPDMDPNSFTGSIGFKINDSGVALKDIPADQNQFVPRGAFLRNTETIYAVVVYTGMDTKIMRNAEEGKPKSSAMENTMNSFILCILGFQLTCAFIMSCCSFYWMDRNRTRDLYPYLYLDKDSMSTSGQSALVYFSYFILFNTMIPISLIVSLEMVKVLQSYFISSDKEMYSEHNDKMPKVMTSTINEELGQVEYIFSDKTGTLTQNQMQFKMAIIGNTLYGEKAANSKPANTNNADHKPQKKQKHSLSEFVFQDDILSQVLSKQAHKDDNPQIGLTLKSLDGKASYSLPTQLDLIKEYFQVLGFTHECIVEKNKDPEDKTLYYQGPSPDEITLVDAAYHMGFAFIGKTSNKLQMNVTTDGKQQVAKEVTKINVFEFSSARKRNTLILEDNGVYKMFVKGADNVIKERLDMKIAQPYLENADKKLTEFSVVGLRTLLIGMKIMSKDEVDRFTSQYNDLSNSPNRKEDLEKLADEVERGFFLLGATAVEDKLQDDVPETIHDLIRANIKVWMLTGDKLETAENIAKSCKLILADFELLVMSDKNPKVVRKMMTEVLWRRFKQLKESKIRKCFLVEGDCLKIIFADGNEDIKKKFVQITKECESVVCCRVSPVQKAQVVRSIREGLNKITLAIGDGANDVNMIQAAHIGCGIYGNEGMRAVQSSDFAFGQFKCLWRLLFVHGRWSYIRISEMIVYFFYKNMVFTIPQFFFAFFSGFSAQSIFDDYYISLYNLIFTALPLVIRAIFDQDVNYLYLQINKNVLAQTDGIEKHRIDKLINKRKQYIRERLPNLYYIGQKQQLFSTNIFLEWIVQGFLHGLIIFFISFWSVGDHIYENDGYTSDQWSFSLIIYTSVVLIADIKLAINTKYWTVINYVAFYATSIGLYFAAFFITGQLTSSNVYETPNYLVSTPHFYLVIFFVVGAIFAVDLAVYNGKSLFENKTKEKALRKLMKSQPHKNQDKNKWVLEGSAIELESNLASFMDKQLVDESSIMLNSFHQHGSPPVQANNNNNNNNLPAVEPQHTKTKSKNQNSATAIELAEKPRTTEQIKIYQMSNNANNKDKIKPEEQPRPEGGRDPLAINGKSQDSKGTEVNFLATIEEGRDSGAKNPQEDGGELAVEGHYVPSPSPRGSVLMGVEPTENTYEPILLITFSDEEDYNQGSKDAAFSSSSWPSHPLKPISPRTIKIAEDKQSQNRDGVIRINQQKRHSKKDDIENQ